MIPLDKSTPLLIWSCTELGVVIMASSIPFFRLFWKEIRTRTSKSRSKTGYTNPTYNLDNINSFGGHTQLSSRNRTRVEADPTFKSPDDSSDRSILGDARTKSGIRRTDVVTIEQGVDRKMEATSPV